MMAYRDDKNRMQLIHICLSHLRAPQLHSEQIRRCELPHHEEFYQETLHSISAQPTSSNMISASVPADSCLILEDAVADLLYFEFPSGRGFVQSEGQYPKPSPKHLMPDSAHLTKELFNR